MKVLMLNGSPKATGNTNAALLEVGRTLASAADSAVKKAVLSPMTMLMSL